MKLSLVALAAASVQAAALNSTAPFESIDSPTAGYIIELEPAAAHSKRDAHTLFHRSALNSANYSVRHEFTDTEYFYGLSVDATEEEATILADMPGVKNIWPNRVHARPAPYRGSSVADSDGSKAELSARGNVTGFGNITVAHVTGDSDVNSAHKMAGVDKVHKLGITGKGVKIGVIDTGVDYRHPALGGGFGPGHKIAGGYDLVGENYTGANIPVPDDDPLVTCLQGGHGTHVVGTIVARDPKGMGFGVVGVAPDASIYAYRIFSCTGSAADDVILQAFERAAKDGVDLISMSAGYSNLWETNSPYAAVMKSLRDKGVGIIIAAGNDGERGPYFTSTPALVQDVIAVGSTANIKFTTMYRAKDSAGQTIEYAGLIPMSDSKGKYNVFTVPNEQSSCGSDDLKNAYKDFADKGHLIALLSANSVCAYDLRGNFAGTGIKEVWWEAKENVDFRIEDPGYYPGFTVSEISSSEAKKMRDGLAQQGKNYTLSFSDQSVHDTKQWDGGLMSIYSTMGPTMEMSLKPQISAPGGNILNLWPVTNGVGYAIVSGTSMATPFLAGVYALIKSSDRSLTNNDIRRRIQNSADPVVDVTQRDMLSTTAYQGAGMVNALKAIGTKFTASPSELSLRDSSKPKAQTITIENKSNAAKTYTISHKGAGMAYGLPQILTSNLNNQFKWIPGSDAKYATAQFSATSLKVAAMSKTTFQVTILPPTDSEVQKLPIYSGYVTITSDDKESISVPYIGVPYSRDSVAVLDTTNLTDSGYNLPTPPKGVPSIPKLFNTGNSVRNNDIGNYTFKDGSAPGVYLSVRQPSQYIRLDLVPVDTPFKPTHYGYDVNAKTPEYTKPTLDLSNLDNLFNVSSYGAFLINDGNPKLPSAGELGRLWRGYGAFTAMWDTPKVSLNNGTTYQLPNADYRILFRALKWGHDYQDPASYESWLSPITRINA